MPNHLQNTCFTYSSMCNSKSPKNHTLRYQPPQPATNSYHQPATNKKSPAKPNKTATNHPLWTNQPTLASMFHICKLYVDTFRFYFALSYLCPVEFFDASFRIGPGIEVGEGTIPTLAGGFVVTEWM